MKAKQKYGTYILTEWETEVEHSFASKKQMLSYLAKASKEYPAFVISAFSIDKDGYKTNIETKYSKFNL